MRKPSEAFHATLPALQPEIFQISRDEDNFEVFFKENMILLIIY